MLAEGAEKHEAWNWLDIPIDDHINHAMAHLVGYLSGDRSENHLAHAACRVHFASELEERYSSTTEDLMDMMHKSPSRDAWVYWEDCLREHLKLKEDL